MRDGLTQPFEAIVIELAVHQSYKLFVNVLIVRQLTKTNIEE